MGGLNPLSRAFSQGLYSSSRNSRFNKVLWLPLEANPKGNPFWGVFPEQSRPRMAPLISGLLGICWGVFL